MRRPHVLPLLLLITLGAGCHAGPPPPPTCDNPTSTARVTLADFVFEPTCASVEAGSTVTLQNRGAAPHTFTVEGSDIDVHVDAGQTETVDLGSLPAGTYRVVCTIHPQMIGALRVSGGLSTPTGQVPSGPAASPSSP